MSFWRDTHRKLDELQKRFKLVEKRLDALEHNQTMPDPTVVLRTRQDTIFQRISSLEACKNQVIMGPVRWLTRVMNQCSSSTCVSTVTVTGKHFWH